MRPLAIAVLIVAAGCCSSPPPERLEPRAPARVVARFYELPKPAPERPVRDLGCYEPKVHLEADENGEVTLAEWCDFVSRRYGVNVIAEGSARNEKISLETLSRHHLPH